MPRPASSRFLAALLLLLGTLVSPGGSLSHGVAHLREAEHRAGHDAVAAESHHQPGEREIEPDDHHDDHAHVRVDDGIRPRAVLFLAPVAEPVLVPVARELAVAAEAPLPHATRPRADPHTGPPPTLRAPPAA